MGNTTSLVEILFRWHGFSDVLEGLHDDTASRWPWSHKGAISRLELDRDLVQNRTAA
jgi:hypothetical protein